FTEGLIDDEKQSFIKNTLKECKTGVDRIAAPLLDKEGVVIAHKTGSGYVNQNQKKQQFCPTIKHDALTLNLNLHKRVKKTCVMIFHQIVNAFHRIANQKN
ncbi:hypothetical protein, partial [Erwinia amylovora]|uniref:hypothetical protein n=1 Tax=Erwinia amylovora TaxID=552 RepID=UPI003D6E0504